MNWQKFHKSIQGLKGWRESAFLLALSQRAMPNAQLYFFASDEAGSPNGEQLESVFDTAWRDLIRSPNEERLIVLLDQVVDWVPDTDADAQYGAIPTADCLELLEQALLSGINDDQARALAASQRSLATITQFIEFTEGEGLSEEQLIRLFDQHPLVLREFSFQQELRDLLRAAKSPADTIIRSIRDLAYDEGVSNIGISCEEG